MILLVFLLTMEATHATEARVILDLDLGFDLLLFGLLGIDVDVASADLALGLAVEDAVSTLCLCVAASLLLPHLPELLKFDDLLLLRPAVFVA